MFSTLVTGSIFSTLPNPTSGTHSEQLTWAQSLLFLRDQEYSIQNKSEQMRNNNLSTAHVPALYSTMISGGASFWDASTVSSGWEILQQKCFQWAYTKLLIKPQVLALFPVSRSPWILNCPSNFFINRLIKTVHFVYLHRRSVRMCGPLKKCNI